MKSVVLVLLVVAGVAAAGWFRPTPKVDLKSILEQMRAEEKYHKMGKRFSWPLPPSKEYTSADFSANIADYLDSLNSFNY